MGCHHCKPEPQPTEDYPYMLTNLSPRGDSDQAFYFRDDLGIFTKYRGPQDDYDRKGHYRLKFYRDVRQKGSNEDNSREVTID